MTQPTSNGDDVSLPVVARLYYSGHGHRRYRRASTRPGPGEPLTFTSVALEALRRERAHRNELADAARDLVENTGNPNCRARLQALLEHIAR